LGGLRVAVTGAGGFVGAAVTRRLAALDHETVAIVRSAAPRLDGVDVDVVRLDLESEGAAGRVADLGADVCIHAAAAGAVTASRDVELLLRANALVPWRLANALAATGTRLVSLGSSSEYGPSEGPMSERQAAAPDDPYGASKLAGAALIRASSVEAVHLRLFSVYGPGEDPARLIPSLVEAALAGRTLELSPGEQVRDFVHVEDVVDAIVAAAFAPSLPEPVLNVGTGVQTTVRDAAAAVARAAGVDGSCFRFGAKPYRDAARERLSWRADTALVEQTLGWRASRTLEQGLADTVAAARRSMRS
jgi:nucleoside-diphosphate-sugar epimerase